MSLARTLARPNSLGLPIFSNACFPFLGYTAVLPVPHPLHYFPFIHPVPTFYKEAVLLSILPPTDHASWPNVACSSRSATQPALIFFSAPSWCTPFASLSLLYVTRRNYLNWVKVTWVQVTACVSTPDVTGEVQTFKTSAIPPPTAGSSHCCRKHYTFHSLLLPQYFS
eukprot:scaffold656_cov403-Pavlova_lutheri.AAC.48